MTTSSRHTSSASAPSSRGAAAAAARSRGGPGAASPSPVGVPRATGQYPAPVDTARSGRVARLFMALTVGAVTLMCVPFLLGAPYPAWLTFVGRWVPLLVAVVLIRLVPVGGRTTQLLGLRTGGWRTLLTSLLAAVGVFLALAFGPALLAQALGWGTMIETDVLLGALVQLPLWVALLSLSTVGEEAAWRGYAQQLLRHRGFWSSTLLIGAAWALLHVPQISIFVVAGDLDPRDLAGGVLGVFFLALPLAALVERFGTVWPAVVGHAVPFTALTLLTSTTGLGYWAVLTVTGAASVLAAALLRPRVRSA